MSGIDNISGNSNSMAPLGVAQKKSVNISPNTALASIKSSLKDYIAGKTTAELFKAISPKQSWFHLPSVPHSGAGFHGLPHSAPSWGNNPAHSGGGWNPGLKKPLAPVQHSPSQPLSNTGGIGFHGSDILQTVFWTAIFNAKDMGKLMKAMQVPLRAVQAEIKVKTHALENAKSKDQSKIQTELNALNNYAQTLAKNISQIPNFINTMSQLAAQITGSSARVIQSMQF